MVRFRFPLGGWPRRDAGADRLLPVMGWGGSSSSSLSKTSSRRRAKLASELSLSADGVRFMPGSGWFSARLLALALSMLGGSFFGMTNLRTQG